jgi:ribosomal protein L32
MIKRTLELMKCPRCGHEQNPGDTCLQCGIVFVKYQEIQERKADNRPQSLDESQPEVIPDENKLKAFLVKVFHPRLIPWQPVTTLAMISLSAGFAFMVYLLANESLLGSGSTTLYLTHNVNLVFHEAGHWIFGVFGNRTLAIFGGSLNQVLIPLIVAASFWTKRDAVGFAFGLFWCFENFLDVAVYMADARALVLPLIGGLGEEAHDWRNLFLHFGLIEQDTAIAAKTKLIGWVGMIATWLWFFWRWSIDRKSSLNSVKY